METIACTIGGLLLIAVSIGLNFVHAPQWLRLGQHDADGEPRRESVQSLFRRINNAVLAVTGGFIIATGYVPHGKKTWALLWAGVILGLLIALVLAAFDAMASWVGYRRSIPEVARRSFSRNQS